MEGLSRVEVVIVVVVVVIVGSDRLFGMLYRGRAAIEDFKELCRDMRDCVSGELTSSLYWASISLLRIITVMPLGIAA